MIVSTKTDVSVNPKNNSIYYVKTEVYHNDILVTTVTSTNDKKYMFQSKVEIYFEGILLLSFKSDSEVFVVDRKIHL